jgi:hypothetical protein
MKSWAFSCESINPSLASWFVFNRPSIFNAETCASNADPFNRCALRLHPMESRFVHPPHLIRQWQSSLLQSSTYRFDEGVDGIAGLFFNKQTRIGFRDP